MLWAVNPGEHRVERYPAVGESDLAWGTTGMETDKFCGCCNPSHIAVTPNGKFVTAEKGIPRVKIYDATGLFVGVVAEASLFSDHPDPGCTGPAHITDIAVNSAGQVLVLDGARSQLWIFSPLDKD